MNPFLFYRQKLESKREDLTGLLQTTKESYESELRQLRSLSSEQDTRVDILNHQLTQMEKERTLVEVDSKNVKRRMGYLEEENTKLKEEVRRMMGVTVIYFKNIFSAQPVYLIIQEITELKE